MNSKQTIMAALVTLLIGAGCAKEKGGDVIAVVPAPGPGVCTVNCTPGAPTPTGSGGYYSGSSANLTLTSTAALARMFFNSNPNSPTDARINIDLNRGKDAVVVSYVDGGNVVESAFGTQHPNSSASDDSLNGWVTQGTKLIWKGFFQDTYGAVIIIIDDTVSQGDGTAGDLLSGSIWFQNFNQYYPNFGAQGPLKMCWQIEMGPYDCRTFIKNGVVNMTSSYYPNNKGPDANKNYEKLADFTGLTREAAGF